MSSWNIHGSLVIFQNNFKTVDKFNRRLSMPHVTYLLCWLFRGDESHLNTNDVLRRTEFDDASVNKWTSRKWEIHGFFSGKSSYPCQSRFRTNRFRHKHQALTSVCLIISSSFLLGRRQPVSAWSYHLWNHLCVVFVGSSTILDLN